MLRNQNWGIRAATINAVNIILLPKPRHSTSYHIQNYIMLRWIHMYSIYIYSIYIISATYINSSTWTGHDCAGWLHKCSSGICVNFLSPPILLLEGCCSLNSFQLHCGWPGLEQVVEVLRCHRRLNLLGCNVRLDTWDANVKHVISNFNFNTKQFVLANCTVTFAELQSRAQIFFFLPHRLWRAGVLSPSNFAYVRIH